MHGLFDNISPKNLSLSAFIVANIISEGLTINEQNTLGNWLDLVGEVIITNASQQQLLLEQNSNDDDDKHTQIKG